MTASPPRAIFAKQRQACSRPTVSFRAQCQQNQSLRTYEQCSQVDIPPALGEVDVFRRWIVGGVRTGQWRRQRFRA